MTRTVIFTAIVLAVVVFGIAIATNDTRTTTPQAAAPEPDVAEPAATQSDSVASTAPQPDINAEGPSARTEMARSDTGAASQMATDAAVAALEETGQPVQGAIDEVREIAETFGTVGAEAGDVPQNDEASLQAPAVDASQASDPAFVADALSPESFDAELVAALIEAAPHLSTEQKTDLRVAVQVVAQAPDGRKDVLNRIENILLRTQ
ncbi:MAG: hypothetical protein AAFQ79_13260 [Pseudomonadota bacterium]